MMKAGFLKLSPTDLRRTAAQTHEPERERKMLALAEQLEEREAATPSSAGKHENGTPS